ncbi:hypothetical protein GWK47_007913 [Chionoecetes opilio]|uniref:Uncharacterized protein n=1 Tax=Chionoecetes opilio TaxID=41210 RepID=A0A8J4Y5H1_CHIOP|nr:hypothetical protein GWK47_007913 [Chionoecetes opilio]
MVSVRVKGRRVAACVLLLVASLGVCHLIALHSQVVVTDRVSVRLMIERDINSNANAVSSPTHLACQHPTLEVDNPEIFKFFQDVDPVVCGEEAEWVAVKGSLATITKEARAKHGDIECAFTEVLRDGDDRVQRGFTTTTHDSFTLANTDFYSVSCTGQDGKTWENIIAGIRQEEEVRANTGWDKLPQDALHLNFLMIGFDSLSRNTFIRRLPKTYAFLTEVLGAHVMQGYNIVGDGTTQQILPIMTGKTELELPEARRRMGSRAQFVNAYPLVWNDFAKNGYVTMFAEDVPHIGTFQYRLRGFDAPPTHHYLRPFFLKVYPEYAQHPRLCLRNTPRHKVFLDYVHNFMTEYRDRPKFAFAFHGELSHDDFNLITVADEDLLALLTSLRNEGHLNKTMLVVMSDHGHRFSSIRGTLQGKQEERLPFLALALPQSFKAAHPSSADNIRMNIHRLTTPFDLYPTMQDILHFPGARLGQVVDRGISLFSQIPAARTCADAFVEPHWCACLSWEPISVEEDMVKRAAHALVHYVNTYTSTHRSLCLQLRLGQLLWAGKLLPTKGLLKFKKNMDVDGFLPDLTDETSVSEVVYQVTLTTSPGLARYEASLTYSIKLDTFSVKMDDVSRTNKYGDQAHCVEKNLDHLRKFCYCREPPPPPPQDT